jgi:hypothetical protein
MLAALVLGGVLMALPTHLLVSPPRMEKTTTDVADAPAHVADLEQAVADILDIDPNVNVTQAITHARGCKAKVATVYSLGSGGILGTSVPLDAEEFDTDAFHSTSVDNTVITIPAGLAGIYQITAFCQFAASAIGTRHLGIFCVADGNTVYLATANELEPSATFTTVLNLTGVISLLEGDTVELKASSATEGVNLGPCWISVVRLGK